jgi:tetratricopeptide (TPR) repeat protein
VGHRSRQSRTSRRIAIAAALLLQLIGVSLAAQPQESARKIPQLREALQEYREKEDVPREAITLLLLGAAEADMGNVDNALSNAIDAANKNDVLVTWMAHFTLAHVENAVGRPKEAVAQIERALTVIGDASASGAPFSVRALAASGLLPETIASESNAA